jgi:hypothetical protein
MRNLPKGYRSDPNLAFSAASGGGIHPKPENSLRVYLLPGINLQMEPGLQTGRLGRDIIALRLNRLVGSLDSLPEIGRPFWFAKKKKPGNFLGPKLARGIVSF